MIGAIDIGGTKIALGLVSDEGRILRQAVFPTEPECGFADGMERVRAALLKLLAEAGAGLSGLRGIGVGCTGPLDPFSGVLGHNADTLPSWQNHSLVEGLSDLGAPVVVENDADTAALGEYTWGVGQGCGRFLYVTFSTGIGSGAILDHKLYRGVDGSHPEVGHSIVDPNGPPCYCGTRLLGNAGERHRPGSLVQRTAAGCPASGRAWSVCQGDLRSGRAGRSPGAGRRAA